MHLEKVSYIANEMNADATDANESIMAITSTGNDPVIVIYLLLTFISILLTLIKMLFRDILHARLMSYGSHGRREVDIEAGMSMKRSIERKVDQV